MRLPIPFEKLTVVSKSLCADCDISFLTRVTSLEVYGVVGCSLTIPSTVVNLVLKYDVRDVFVLSTENLRSLEVPNDTVTTTECPKIEELKWVGDSLTSKVFSFGEVSSFSAMTITAHDVDPSYGVSGGPH